MLFHFVPYILAAVAGWLYIYSHKLTNIQNPSLVAPLLSLRIALTAGFLYYLLNSPPIHSILIVILFGTTAFIAAQRRS